MLKRLLAASLLIALPLAGADTLLLDGIDAAQTSAHQRPRRGMSMDAVQSTFGSPSTQRSAIGDPPITRWEYPDFTVYFEYQHVIHAVSTP